MSAWLAGSLARLLARSLVVVWAAAHHLRLYEIALRPLELRLVIRRAVGEGSRGEVCKSSVGPRLGLLPPHGVGCRALVGRRQPHLARAAFLTLAVEPRVAA